MQIEKKTGRASPHYQLHGYSKTEIYRRWRGMKRRCAETKGRTFLNYGARGITVCASWLLFQNFLRDMEATYKSGYSLDRIDNSRGYSPENCRWIPLAEQSLNKRTVRMHEYNGEKMTVTQIEKVLGFYQGCIGGRLRERGMSLEQAITDVMTLRAEGKIPRRKLLI